jgi:tRNA-intron endonuclease
MKKIIAQLNKEIISTNDPLAQTLQRKSSFGEKIGEKIQYSLSESLYLLEKNKIEIFQKNKNLTFDEVLNKFIRLDKKIQIKYPVFKDLREKGHIVKTALRFGAEFRVYKKGTKIGNSHAKWIVFTEHEAKKLNWHEFSSKNRVAHSTKKKLLLAIVDEESKINYYEVSWIKP